MGGGKGITAGFPFPPQVDNEMGLLPSRKGEMREARVKISMMRNYLLGRPLEGGNPVSPF